MPGLFSKDPATPEGKYPRVIRRDGTDLLSRFLVITLRDPCAAAAFRAYADEAKRRGLDPVFVADMRELALEAEREVLRVGPGDPDAGPHRVDDPETLAIARRNGCPGT